MEFLSVIFVLYSIQNLVLWHGYLREGMKATWKLFEITKVKELLAWNFILGYPLWRWRKEIYKHFRTKVKK